MPDRSHETPTEVRPSFATALKFWHRLGWISFGGPAGQIAIMQHELVDRFRWIDQKSFLHGLNFCMLLPGPEAQQLATYIGWRMHGWRGAVAAGSLFVLPGAAVMWGLSWLIAAHGEYAPVAAALSGVKSVVVAIVIHAVWRIGRRALKGYLPPIMAAAAFVAIYFLGIDFPWIVAAAGLIGWLAGGMAISPFAPPSHGPSPGASGATIELTMPAGASRNVALLLGFAALWAIVVGAVILGFGATPYADVAKLFTTAAFVTFGGAYAVLPYVADAAVNDLHWLGAGDMLTGLAMAETTPGPLILVLQYVGFIAGWRQPGALPPLAAATLAAALTTFVTFLPSFLFILLGAPYIQRIGNNRRAASALGAITAAVVGVVLNLAVFFAQAVFFSPKGLGSGFDWLAAVTALAAAYLLFRHHIGLHWLVLAGAAVGLGPWVVLGALLG